MGSFLDQDDLVVAKKIARYILIIFSTLYFLLSILMGWLGHNYPMFVNLFLACIYLYSLKKLDLLEVNSLVYTVHFVCIVYAIFMVLYFGWSFGAQYFLIPCIAFCYVGQFENRKIIYTLAIFESIVFELLYIFMEVNKYTLQNQLYVLGYNINGIFYIIHSLFACLTIIIVMYFLKIKVYKTIETKENVNEVLSINASTDPLTYLLNRWAFMEKIHLIQYKKNFHFALIDIDFFKKVNDTYGHSVGDEVLRVTASCIKLNFSRYTDMIARWGGEEFLVFALGCSEEEFYEACNNFRKELKNNKFCAGDFTISASVGCLHVNGDFSYSNFDNYIKKVDELLYMAKNSGRNRIEAKRIEDE
ncbi:GGDEF domain-containing protein [Campylobacter sp. RM12640]|uniref:GGDEF domain-containing protein n=2 Tax=Campylobacter TaxID=194 RepID=UPI001BDAC09A|nr:GGDEF domain-containing protein [Campylobacter sp. 2018MI13]MBT0881910.1 GGDEF domain-containing protein [Campylobacter sp. 2018MI13]MBZ7981787.1 GGDEF domain-containing protein [Campylobacter sp. RM12640]MBZ7983181.1 GGDEF domain-containing protein [Campylobacter sp. RM12647]MBZ7988665.1 GGDEF domain-containing protein [Campylobacter sp. RM12635]